MCDVPALRFPEFSGEWEKLRLSDFATKITKKNKGNIVKNVLCNSANLGLVPQGNYFDREIANTENTDGYYVICNGDFVYNPRKSTAAPFGPVNIYEGEDAGIISPLYLCFSVHNIFPKFLYYRFKSSAWHSYVYSHGDSGVRFDRVSIKDDVFFDMPIYKPAQDEQIKIATLLQLIDDRISTQNKIIEKLETLIKGIRNNIISKIKGDCIVLQDIADIYQPQTIASTDLTEDGYLVYGANGIIGKYHSFNHEKEQICITCRGNTCGTVNFTEPKSWITGNAMVINTDNYAKNVNKRYLFHYLASINFNSIISGSGQPQIVRQPLAKLKLILPVLIIQNRIAECLDAMFAKMKNEQSFLQILQIQKSCLLSQMFT